MGKKTESGAKSVQPGKQVEVVATHRRGAGRKAGHAKGKPVSRHLATRALPKSFIALSPQELLGKAIAKGDINTLERLLQMRRELEEEHAKKEYMQSLARFQRICPVIPKTKIVRNKAKEGEEGTIRYRYAPLDVIIGLVHQPLAECGFSYMIEGEQKENAFTAIVQGYHVGGHSKNSRMTVPIMASDYMTAPQSVASAQTFSKRQAFCNLWGIVATDTDDDAQSAGLPTPNVGKGKATDGAAERIKEHVAQRNVTPGTLPENPGIKNVEDLLKQMTWLPETTAAMYRKQAQQYVQKKDEKSLRGLQQSLNKQIAMKGAKKS